MIAPASDLAFVRCGDAGEAPQQAGRSLGVGHATAQRVRIRAAGAQLLGRAVDVAAHHLGMELGMELQAPGARADAKGLVRPEGIARQAHGARG